MQYTEQSEARSKMQDHSTYILQDQTYIFKILIDTQREVSTYKWKCHSMSSDPLAASQASISIVDN